MLRELIAKLSGVLRPEQLRSLSRLKPRALQMVASRVNDLVRMEPDIATKVYGRILARALEMTIDDSQKMKAQNLVDALLSDTFVRACAACDKERGIQRRPDEASHTSCRRHAIESYTQIMGREAAEKKIAAMPDEYFVPETAA